MAKRVCERAPDMARPSRFQLSRDHSSLVISRPRMAAASRSIIRPTAARLARDRHIEEAAKEPEASPGEKLINGTFINILKGIDSLVVRASAAEKVASADTGRRPGMYDGMVSGIA